MIGQSTGFGFDAENATLEARVWLASMGATNKTPGGVATIKDRMESRLQSILEGALSPLPKTNITLNGTDGRIFLSGAMPLNSLTFREMLFSLRRLERLAERLTSVCGREHLPYQAIDLASSHRRTSELVHEHGG